MPKNIVHKNALVPAGHAAVITSSKDGVKISYGPIVELAEYEKVLFLDLRERQESFVEQFDTQDGYKVELGVSLFWEIVDPRNFLDTLTPHDIFLMFAKLILEVEIAKRPVEFYEGLEVFKAVVYYRLQKVSTKLGVQLNDILISSLKFDYGSNNQKGTGIQKVEIKDKRSIIFDSMNNSFDIDDVKTLCFELGIDFDVIKGDNKIAKIRELILHCERLRRIGELTDRCRKMRPDIEW